MKAALVLGILLSCLATALPSSTDGREGARSVMSTPNATFSSNAATPIGPADFYVVYPRPVRPRLLDRKELFDFVANLLATEALKDFSGLLLGPAISFHDPNYPHVSIVATGAVPPSGMPRAFLLWGIARIMNSMVQNSRFITGHYPLVWRGAPAGVLAIVLRPDSQYGDSVLAVSRRSAAYEQNDTVAVPDASMLSFSYEFHGNLLPMEHICMGTIGALIQAAQLPERTQLNFIGGFVPYRALHSWTTVGDSPAMDKEMVVSGVHAAMRHSLLENNSHELHVWIRDYGLLFAEGGYIQYPHYAPSPGGTLSASTW
ncbi:MAG: hypothetical protein LQ350_008524 [Teloschistes chrysophthalmus]|nr:MAG: hypothetical protein LQ350_008524 [Niorma chrysophthalma]